MLIWYDIQCAVIKIRIKRYARMHMGDVASNVMARLHSYTHIQYFWSFNQPLQSLLFIVVQTNIYSAYSLSPSQARPWPRDIFHCQKQTPVKSSMASSADFSNIADKSAVPAWAMCVWALAFFRSQYQQCFSRLTGERQDHMWKESVPSSVQRARCCYLRIRTSGYLLKRQTALSLASLPEDTGSSLESSYSPGALSETEPD